MTLSFHKPLLMGILNVTPDSFSDGGKFNSVETAIEHAKQMISHGADIIDVGGESTRPGSDPVSLEEELQRVLPVIDELLKLNILISIDTMKPEVAKACVEKGVHILNDVTGLRNEKMVEIANKFDTVIIMHMLGEPKTMQKDIHYNNLIEDIKKFLYTQAEKVTSQVVIDPGIGFGKTKEDNYTIMKNLREFSKYPILVGPSRKSFLGGNVEDRLPATLAVVSACVINGASIIRVHDVKECKQAVETSLLLRQSLQSGP